jgi:hypothetical protein
MKIGTPLLSALKAFNKSKVQDPVAAYFENASDPAWRGL